MSQNGDKQTQFKSSTKHKESKLKENKDSSHNNDGHGNGTNKPHSHEHGSMNGHSHGHNQGNSSNGNGTHYSSHSNNNHRGHRNHRGHDHGHGHHNLGYNRQKHKHEILNHEAFRISEDVLKDIDGQVLVTKHDQHILPYCWTIWHHFRYGHKPKGIDNDNSHENEDGNENGHENDPENDHHNENDPNDPTNSSNNPPPLVNNESTIPPSDPLDDSDDTSKQSLKKKKRDGKLSDEFNYLQMTKEVEFPKFSTPTETLKNFASIEQMWLNLSLLGKCKDAPIGTEYFIFKSGINPAWEDPLNTKGGRWIFKFIRRNNNSGDELIRTRTNLIWERLILRVLTGSLISDEEYGEGSRDLVMSVINGIVLSIRKEEDIISLWNSNLNLNKSKKFSTVPIRRILCDSILRVIRECDLILLGESIYNTSESSNERIKRVTFEYRAHSDFNSSSEKLRKFSKNEGQSQSQAQSQSQP